MRRFLEKNLGWMGLIYGMEDLPAADLVSIEAGTSFEESPAFDWSRPASGTTVLKYDELTNNDGFYGERTLNLVMPGLDGVQKRKELMKNLRSAPPASISGEAVSSWRDYLSGTETDMASGDVKKIDMRDSNVLSYTLSDGTVILVRPSGTEPKVKVYVLTRGESREDCAEKVSRYSAWAEDLSK